jgi:hypothetical protein
LNSRIGVCVHEKDWHGFVRVTLAGRDRPGRLTSPAFHACGSASPFCTRCRRSGRKQIVSAALLLTIAQQYLHVRMRARTAVVRRMATHGVLEYRECGVVAAFCFVLCLQRWFSSVVMLFSRTCHASELTSWHCHPCPVFLQRYCRVPKFWTH